MMEDNQIICGWKCAWFKLCIF